MVIETGAARGRRIAAWPSLKTDLRNAGAQWMDEEVVVDGTSCRAATRRHPGVQSRDDQLFGRPRRAPERSRQPSVH